MAAFLGKLTNGQETHQFFLDATGGAVAVASSSDNVSKVEAWKRLALKSTEDLNVAELQGFLSLHGCSIEVLATKPDQEWVHSLRPLQRPKRKFLEQSLSEVESDLAAAEKDWVAWKGVRDIQTAEENLRERQDQIFDLNQKIIHSVQEPQFIYHGSGPPRKTVSAFQQFDRHRYHELKYQAKERASAIRQRIDFTRRIRLKALKDQRKELLDEIVHERRRERDHATTVLEIAKSNEAASIVVVARVGPVLVKGRIGPAVASALVEAHDLAKRVTRGLKERFGLIVKAIGPFGIPAEIRSLVASEGLRASVASMVERGLSMKASALPAIEGWPNAASEGRFAYLGLALKSDGDATTFPVLFDLDAQGPRHTIAIGASGSGKSYAASLIAEGAADRGVRVIVYDPTWSWTGFSQACTSTKQLARYPAFGLQATDARGYNTQILQPEPNDPCPADPLLDGRGVAVIAPSRLTESQEGLLLESWLRALYERVASMPESTKLNFLLVIEEAHRLKAHPKVEELLELFARTARVRGFGLLFVTQVLTDLAHGLRSQASTHLLMKTAYTQDLTRAGQIAGKAVQLAIPALRQGTGFAHFSDYGQPLLVAFRPPLHSQAAVAELQAHCLQLGEALTRLVGRIVRRPATIDVAATTVVSSSNPAQKATPRAPEGMAVAGPATWRDVVSRFTDSRVPAPTILKATQAAGLQTPSVRTIQRFLRFRAPAAASILPLNGSSSRTRRT